MITVNNKQFRNLEEQVRKNKEDIAAHYEIDRVLSDWGIKVLGVYASADLLPTENNEYGDAYGVGITEPYTYYIWTRANSNVGQETDYWLNVGALSIVGPQGPRGNVGPIGPQGREGSQWYSGLTAPSPSTSYYTNDHYLNTATGDVYRYSGRNEDPNLVGHWSLMGNIRGPQGIQGLVGPQGVQGIQGPIGPQGVKGDTGSSFTIAGLLASTDLLPTPTEANRHKAYAVGNSTDGYDLYVVVGEEELLWVNIGKVEGVEGPQGPIGPQGPAGIGATIIPISSTLKTGTLTSTQLQTINEATYPIINLNNEYFVKADIYTNDNEVVFSHVGNRGGIVYNKTIRLNTITGVWSLKEVLVKEVIDLELYDNGDDTFTIPEEYRPFDVLKNVMFAYSGTIFFFLDEGNGDTEDYEAYFNSVPTIGVSEYRISMTNRTLACYPDGTAEISSNSVRLSPARRLDDPSAWWSTYNSQPQSTNFINWYKQRFSKFYKGQTIMFHIAPLGGPVYGMITSFGSSSNPTLTLKPLGIYLTDADDMIVDITLTATNELVVAANGINSTPSYHMGSPIKLEIY